MNGKEALEELKDIRFTETVADIGGYSLRTVEIGKNYKKECAVIEKELNDYELLKKQYNDLLYTANDLNNENVDLRKKVKNLESELDFEGSEHLQTKLKLGKAKQVLEIIKKKKVSVYLVDVCDSYKEYNHYTQYPYNPLEELTENEFSLIKEWLKNEIH